MALGSTPTTWYEALEDFLYHLQATKSDKTVRFYQTQMRQIITWAQEHQIPFDGFTKRHLDRYLALRSQSVSRATMRHDAIAVKAFFRWCAKNDLIARSPLAEYEIHAAPTPAKYMPTDADMQALLKAVHDYWNVEKNPGMKHIPPTRRLMHRERNYALILMLLDTAARIGEIIGLQIEDYRAHERQILIRESKGREPRALPLSPGAIKAVTTWLRVRERLLSDTPADQAEPWLFLSEYGGRMDESRFLKALKGIVRWAGLSEQITLHSLRRYSLNKLAKANLLAAQTIAGHKDARTTLIYTKLDPDFIRGVHKEVGVVDTVLSNRRVAKRKRLM